jgi:putative transposase
MHKAFRYRLKPTELQEESLRQIGGGCRWLWNTMLAKNKAQYEANKTFVFKHEMIVSLPALKKLNSWMSDLPSQTLQQRCFDLDAAIQRCFRSGCGFPHFKRKDDASDTFRIPQTNGHIKITKDAIKIPKVGWIKWKRHRPIEGKLLSITVKQEGEHWYVVCLCRTGEAPELIDCAEEDIVGIDVGLKTFAITSDGEVFEAGKPNLRRLKKAQRKLSRIDSLNKKNGIKKSNRRKVAKKKLAKIHAHIRNQRSDFHHKASRQIANAYTFAGMEDLNIKGMVKNHCLADAISKQGWRSYRSMCEYKLARKGGKVLLVDRFFPSSKTCSSCGHKQNMPLNVRIFECESCGVVLDRDLNAGINLKLWAIREINRAGTVRIYARGDTSDGQADIYACSHVSLNREKFECDLAFETATSSGSR